MDLFHFSEDPAIRRFTPHVPVSNPSHSPGVWAIDEQHSPLYWFPRDCPRVTAWPRDDVERAAFRAAFCTTSWRVHAIELGWLATLTRTTLYRYRFDASTFRPWAGASGQWIAEETIEPLDVEAITDLTDRHVEAGIELRAVPSLHPLRDLASRGPWDFSIVRIKNARPP